MAFKEGPVGLFTIIVYGNYVIVLKCPCMQLNFIVKVSDKDKGLEKLKRMLECLSY